MHVAINNLWYNYRGDILGAPPLGHVHMSMLTKVQEAEEKTVLLANTQRMKTRSSKSGNEYKRPKS